MGSDGLLLDNSAQRDIVIQGGDADALVNNALTQLDSKDNVSAVVYRFQGAKPEIKVNAADRKVLPLSEFKRLNALLTTNMDFESLSSAVQEFHDAEQPFPLARFSLLNGDKTIDYYAAAKLIDILDHMGGVAPDQVQAANTEFLNVWGLYRNLGMAPGMFREPGNPGSKSRTLGTQVVIGSAGQGPGKAQFEQNLKVLIDSFGQEEITYYNHQDDFRRVREGLRQAAVREVEESINQGHFYPGVIKTQVFAVYDEATGVVRNVVNGAPDAAALKGDKAVEVTMRFNAGTGEYFLTSQESVFSEFFPVYGAVEPPGAVQQASLQSFLASWGLADAAFTTGPAALEALNSAVSAKTGDYSTVLIPVIVGVSEQGEKSVAEFTAGQVAEAIRELRVIAFDAKGQGVAEDFVFVKADGMPPALNASSLGTADSNIFNSEKIRQRVVMAVEREGLGESSIASLELELDAEARDIFNRAREDLEIRGDRFLAAMRLKEADDVIKGILTGAFKADLLEALGPDRK